MAKTLSFELPESDAAELEAILMEMRHANEQMKRDQEEINNLKMETNLIANETRCILEQLEAVA